MIDQTQMQLTKYSDIPVLPEESIESCAAKIVQHLERNIIKHRDDSAKANRLASMNKYIQVTYLSGAR